jgi:hypothetical protein
VTPWEQSVCLLLHLSHLVGPEARESVMYSVDSNPCQLSKLQPICMEQWDRNFSPGTLVSVSVPFYQYSVPTFCSSTNHATQFWQLKA